jgi:hypothetical protein
VLSRSSARPVFVALGTATVITLGAVAVPATAFAVDPSPTAGEDPTPEPSTSPSDPPAETPPPSTPPPHTPPPDKPPPPHASAPYRPPPSLTIRLSLSAASAAPGGSVTATARVSARRAVAHHAVLRFSAPGAHVVGGAISLGDVSAARSASSVVEIPAGRGRGRLTVTASLSADRASTRAASGGITVTGGGGSPAVVLARAGGDLPASPSAPGLPVTAAAAEGGLAQARLPRIAGQREPAVAPNGMPAVRPVSLRTKTSPLGLDAASYRLLWTQVAWLTALLVGVSLLLTQLRLNRRRTHRGVVTRRRV